MKPHLPLGSPQTDGEHSGVRATVWDPQHLRGAGRQAGGWGSWEGARQVEKWGQLEGLKHFHFSDFSER